MPENQPDSCSQQNYSSIFSKYDKNSTARKNVTRDLIVPPLCTTAMSPFGQPTSAYRDEMGSARLSAFRPAERSAIYSPLMSVEGKSAIPFPLLQPQPSPQQ